MKLYLDPTLLNKGPRPSARAPKAPSAPAAPAPASTGSKVADVGTGEKAGAVAPTAPTANAAKRPSARAGGQASASPAGPAAPSAPTAEAPKQSKSGASAGAGTQMITCPLPPDVCYQYGGSGSGKHRANSPIYQKHTEIAAKRGAAKGAAPKAKDAAAPTEKPAQANPAAEQAQDKNAPPGQQATQSTGTKPRASKRKAQAVPTEKDPHTPSSMSPEEFASSGAKVFYTEKGSAYIHHGGKTTRWKAPGIHEGDEGLKKTSKKTIFVKPEDAANSKGFFGSPEGQSGHHVIHRGDKLLLVSQVDGKPHGKDGEISFSEDPQPGWMPLELDQTGKEKFENSYASFHLGHKISEVGDPTDEHYQLFGGNKPKTPSVQLGDQEIHGAAAASVADVPEAPAPKPPKEVPLEKPAKSKAPTGKQKKAKVAPDPAAQQMHSQHLQEYLSGSREGEHHKVIHAMTVAEHRRAAAEFRAAGANDVAKLHEQAAVSKPRLKDLSGTQAADSIPEGERPYSAHYLDGYISHASRYLAGGPGGHPNSRYGGIHSMTESQHNEIAQRLESAGANSAAARHRRIAAMKKDFSTKEKSMLERKDAESKARAETQSKRSVESAARREVKRRESFKVPNNMFEGGSSAAPDAPKNHGDDLRQTGSNALSHLIHNHDMPPEHKRDLLQQVLKLQDMHDRAESPTDEDKAALSQLKSDLGHYGQESYTGRKALPGKRYLSRFEPHELEAHADLAEMAGMGDLASKYRDSAAAKHESNNRDRIKAQGQAAKQKASADAKAAKDKARTDKQQAKATDKAKKDQARADLKEQKAQETAERKRLAAAPHLPGDHGEYVQHAQSHSNRLHDFLNSPADLEPHERETLEAAHKVINSHTQLTSPATPEQRRELSDALKVSQAHMDKAKFHQLGQGEDPKKTKINVDTSKLYQTFASGWHQGSAIAQTAAKDQNAGNLATQLPQAVGATVVDSTKDVLSEDRSKKPNEGDDSETRLKYGDIAQQGSSPKASGSSASSSSSSPDSDYESFNEPEADEEYESFNEPADDSQSSSASESSTPAKKRPSARAKPQSKPEPVQSEPAKKRPSARAKPQAKSESKPEPAQSEPVKKRPSARAESKKSESSSDSSDKRRRPGEHYQAWKQRMKKDHGRDIPDVWSGGVRKSEEEMFGLYLDLSKAVQIPNVGLDSDKEKVKQQNSGNSGGGSGFTPDHDHVGRDWHDDEEEETSKSFLSEMQDLLRSMSENLASQMRPGANSNTETEFLMTQGYSLSEAKYNTQLLNKSFLRKKYDTWLLNRMEKSLSSLWSKQ